MFNAIGIIALFGGVVLLLLIKDKFESGDYTISVWLFVLGLISGLLWVNIL